MDNVAYQEKLAEERVTPLGELEPGVPLHKYQHIERLGHDDVQGLLEGECVVQEKIDGANLTVAHGHLGLVVASRNKIIHKGDVTMNGFKGAVEFVTAHEGIKRLVQENYILRGEWLVRHAISYASEKLHKFYVFDVQRHDGSYVHPDMYIPMLELAGIPYVPVLARITNPTMDQLTELVTGPGEFGAEQKEGVVVKRYDFVNKWRRVVWGKLVSADFREKAKVVHGASKKDAIELRFAAEVVTRDEVMKAIHKIRDDVGGERIPINHMPEVIGRVWHDVFNETLWMFVKARKVSNFNFREAQRMCAKATREYALDYFNGVS